MALGESLLKLTNECRFSMLMMLLCGSCEISRVMQRLILSLDFSSEYHLPPIIQINLCRVDVHMTLSLLGRY